MNRHLGASRFLLALCAAAACTGAMAQAVTYRLNCMNHGSAAPEPIGDREGHGLLVSQATCAVVGGPMDGAIATQVTVWEMDGASAKLVFSQSVQRRPNGRLVGVNTVGTLNTLMQDGRPVGITFNGKGSVGFASGAAAALAGKAFSWTGRGTTPGSFFIDVSFD